METDADSWESSDSDFMPPHRHKCQHFLPSPTPDRTDSASDAGSNVPCSSRFERGMQSIECEDGTSEVAGWDQPCSSQQVIAFNNGEKPVK